MKFVTHMYDICLCTDTSYMFK